MLGDPSRESVWKLLSGFSRFAVIFAWQYAVLNGYHVDIPRIEKVMGLVENVASQAGTSWQRWICDADKMRLLRLVPECTTFILTFLIYP